MTPANEGKSEYAALKLMDNGRFSIAFDKF